MDLMEVRRTLLNMGANMGSLRMAKGTFTPTQNYQKITVSHNLGVTPRLFYCAVSDAGISQESSTKISYYGSLPKSDKQVIGYSKNGAMIESTNVINSASYVSSPTETEVYFGGSFGTNVPWAVGCTYDWYAITWND